MMILEIKNKVKKIRDLFFSKMWLIQLPCELEQQVWMIQGRTISQCVVKGFLYEENSLSVNLLDNNCLWNIEAFNFGKIIFLTYEEAQKHI